MNQTTIVKVQDGVGTLFKSLALAAHLWYLRCLQLDYKYQEA
jgi:hypothetical protein